MPENVANILSMFDKFKSDRMVWENSWEDYAYYTVPRKRGVQSTIEPGDKIPYDVFDTTAIEANLVLAAGLAGYMTNSTQRWFELRARDEKLMNDTEVRQFFSQCAETMYAALSGSNFYQQIHEAYLDLGTFGVGCLYAEEDAVDDVRFYARPPKEIFVAENKRELIDVLFRQFVLTAKQAYEMFGTDAGESVIKAYEEQKDYNKKFDFLQYVAPRPQRDVSKQDSLNKPFVSCYVNITDKKICSEGGYDEFPFFVPRFYKNSSEAYGYGPTSTSYPDIRMINDMMKYYIEAQSLALYPPWLAEDDGLIGTLDLRMAAINYQRQPMSQGQAVQPLKSGTRFDAVIEFLTRVENRIKRAFFVDLFLMLIQMKQEMTATEVNERSQERMLILGPVLGRLQTELLSPTIVRLFQILMRRGKLPEPPRILEGVEWDVVYVSPLAKAQRAIQARDMVTFLSIIMQMATASPQVLDKVNWDAVVDKGAKSYSVDPDIILDDKEVQGIRKAKAEALANQQKLLALQQAADIAKTAGSATKDLADADAVRKPAGQGTQ